MRRVLVVLFFAGVLALPFAVHAQSPIRLTSLQVQLWPEYDQPSMLVISDFRVPESVKLPVSVSMNFPKDAHLVAVASQSADGSLLNTDYAGPTVNETWQTITVQIQTPTTYHLEYYQPLSRTGSQREFTYIWTGDYQVDDLSVNIRIPPDTTSIVTDPDMKPTKAADGSGNLIKDFGALAAGQQFPVKLTYTRSKDGLSVPEESVQPSRPLGSNTPGRVLLSNYLPYVAIGLGVVAVGAAAFYFVQGRTKPSQGKRRAHGHGGEPRVKKDIYCHQCGARAQPGDRFCRVCGVKLRLDE